MPRSPDVTKDETIITSPISLFFSGQHLHCQTTDCWHILTLTHLHLQVVKTYYAVLLRILAHFRSFVLLWLQDLSCSLVPLTEMC